MRRSLSVLLNKLARDCSALAAFSSRTKPSIKAQLRELYKKVHPDLFHSHPEARDANEKSFKLLQEYLSVAKEGGSFRGIAGVPYRFEFFLHSKQPSAADILPKQGTATDSVHRVALTLPPPGRFIARSSASEQLPPAAEKGLGRLLEACGLENHFADEGLDSLSAFSSDSSTTDQLRYFLTEAAELSRQNETVQFTPRRHLSAARTALRLGRQVSAEFTAAARNVGIAEKARLLQQLASALDRVPENVKGLHFLVGQGYGVDSYGNVRLHQEDNALMWSGFLLQLDLESCRSRQSAVQAVRHLEQTVATALGVTLVYSLQQIALAPKYRALLESLAAAARGRGPIFAGPAPEVSLRVTGDSHGHLLGKSGGFTVDSEAGVLSVPINADPERVYEHCQKHGEAVGAALKKAREDDRTLEDLRHRTELRLRLRKLSFDRSLPRENLRSCCIRLNHAASDLKSLFDGLSVRISHVNQVAPESSYIDIAWNFEL